MFLAVLYSFVVMVGYGVATAVSKTLVHRHGVVLATIRRQLVSAGILLCAVLFVGVNTPLNMWMVAGGIALAVVSYGGPFFQLRALSVGLVGVIAPVTSFRIVIMSIVGFLFLGESIDITKCIMIALVVLGIIVATVDIKKIRESDIFAWSSGVPYALTAALIWGLTLPFFQIPSMVLGSLLYAFIVEVSILVTALTHAYATRVSVFSEQRSIVPEVIVGLALAISIVFFNFALETGQVSVVSSFGGASVFVSLIVGAFLYNERLYLRQYIGAGIVVVGILLPLCVALV